MLELLSIKLQRFFRNLEIQISSFAYYFPLDEKLLAQYIFYSWKAKANVSFKEKNKKVRLINNYIYLLKPEETVNLIDELKFYSAKD